MKASKKEKPHGIKHNVHGEKRREQRISLAVTAIILTILISVSGFYVNYMLNQPSTGQPFNFASNLKAAIVDQLSISRPNQTFIDTVINILRQANYSVDYYLGEKVTVEFYRNLPTYNYGLIILRVHSTDIYGQLFTGEPYSNRKYVHEQLADRVLRFSYYGEPPFYFGISPLFVKFNMNGKFQNTVIIMMGCDGLKNTDMAKAFIEKDAKVYISWDDSILGARNDPAIKCLLQHLITEKQTVEKAIAHTMREFEPTTIDNSVLRYYPFGAGELIIGDVKNNH